MGLRKQPDIKTLLARMCDDAYSATHFTRTGLRVHNFQGSKGSWPFAGYINAHVDLKPNDEMNVSEVSAQGAGSRAIAGYMVLDPDKLHKKKVD